MKKLNLKKVTITGADDDTSIDEMLAISKEFTFVEWGILFSPTRGAVSRYPSWSWLLKLKERKDDFKDASFSAHICGGYTQEMLTYGASEVLGMGPLSATDEVFSRYQLNFNAQKHTVCDGFYDLLHKFKKPIILQFNNANLAVNARVISQVKHPIHFLYDSSGGQGVEAQTYSAPIKNHYTGYAGGLTPDNIEQAVTKISTVAGDAEIWIDTETGVRTDDKLDMQKVRSFLEKCKPFIQS